VTINRPPVNSTNEETYNEIRDTFHALDEREDIKVVILTGAGKVFMAGNEMDEFMALAGEFAQSARRNMIISNKGGRS